MDLRTFTIVGKRSREDATEALILVMLADKTIHKDEDSIQSIMGEIENLQKKIEDLSKL